MIQFIKGPWRSGEDDFAHDFNIPESKFAVKKMGKGFVGILGDKLPIEEHKKAAREALEYFRGELAADSGERWDVFILDEINVAVGLGLINREDVVRAVVDFPKGKLLIMTGRGAAEELVNIADVVTEMKEIKHVWNDGKIAEYGVDF